MERKKIGAVSGWRKKSLNSASCGVELAFYSWRSFTCCLNAATLRATHICALASFHPCEMLSKELTRAARVAFLWKAARKKARMQTIPGFPKQAME